MLRSFWMGNFGRRISMGAAAMLLAVGASSSAVQADVKSPYSLSLGVDFTSHFISYGADVWGGGDEPSPFSENSTMFVSGTLTAQISDQLSVFANVWSDNNNNVESAIGGNIQEIDVNLGATYTVDKFAFTIANGWWDYAGSVEHVLDGTVAFNDADMIAKGFALNPSFTLHWRYDGNGGQDEGVAGVFGIKPTFTLAADSKFPVSLSVPASVAIFSDNFQGGDSGFGYASVGLGASVPLSFVPEKFGAWSASANVTYFFTSDDAIPGNPEENFFVTTLSVGMAI